MQAGMTIKINVHNLNFYYGPKLTLANISMAIEAQKITALGVAEPAR